MRKQFPTQHLEITFFPNGSFTLSQLDFSVTPFTNAMPTVNLSPAHVNLDSYNQLLDWCESNLLTKNVYSGYFTFGDIVTYVMECR